MKIYPLAKRKSFKSLTRRIIMKEHQRKEMFHFFKKMFYRLKRKTGSPTNKGLHKEMEEVDEPDKSAKYSQASQFTK